jgi:hypothetical protein
MWHIWGVGEVQRRLSVGWLVGWLVGSLARSFFGWLVSQSVGHLVGWLVGLDGLLVGWLVCLLVGQFG